MSEKEKTSDSGIDVARKSDSGSAGSFAGVDRSSWNDFDDSGQGSSRRGTYDDDVDDDDYDQPQRVDLDAFLGDNLPAGDDVGDEEEEEEDEDEDEEMEDEEEIGDEEDEEYETETEEPGDEILASMNEWK